MLQVGDRIRFLNPLKLPFRDKAGNIPRLGGIVTLTCFSKTGYNFIIQVSKKTSHVLGHEADLSQLMIESVPSNHFDVGGQEQKVPKQQQKSDENL
ncbi:MAG: hypothetical protein ACREGC_03345 [Minisyncoccia bacterium]